MGVTNTGMGILSPLLDFPKHTINTYMAERIPLDRGLRSVFYFRHCIIKSILVKREIVETAEKSL